MKNNTPKHPLEAKMDRANNLLEHLIAVEMYKGGAGQQEVADSLGIAIGKVNRLVKGITPPKPQK